MTRYSASGFRFTNFLQNMLILGTSLGFSYAYYKKQAQMINQCHEGEHEEDHRVHTKASTASRIRGNYENKIRFFSPPEKIFEVFASVKNEDGKLAMNYRDLLRAITPYDYGEL